MSEPKGDGCSFGISFLWRLVTGHPPPFEHCCREHDKPYRRGGPAHLRTKADADFKECVRCVYIRRQAKRLGAVISTAVAGGVRIGGRHNAPPLHLLAKPFVWLGWVESAPDYRWGRVL